MTYDSREDTKAHIARVQDYMERALQNLLARSRNHDQSKLHAPEKAMFDSAVARLNEVQYGTPEYDEAKKALGPALNHHYAENSHHPEHQAIMPDGTVDEEYVSAGLAVSDMSLFDIVEMLMDWKAATERMKDGDIWKSIEYNQKRFGLSDQLTSILRNTSKEMGW